MRITDYDRMNHIESNKKSIIMGPDGEWSGFYRGHVEYFDTLREALDFEIKTGSGDISGDVSESDTLIIDRLSKGDDVILAVADEFPRFKSRREAWEFSQNNKVKFIFKSENGLKSSTMRDLLKIV
ncbi:MAG: hypothetical protein ACE5DX_05725 [Candidatus Dojkabacteria bacterium]